VLDEAQVFVGERTQLIAKIRRRFPELKVAPFTRLEIAEFLGDKALLHAAKHECFKLMPSLAQPTYAKLSSYFIKDLVSHAIATTNRGVRVVAILAPAAFCVALSLIWAAYNFDTWYINDGGVLVLTFFVFVIFEQRKLSRDRRILRELPTGIGRLALKAAGYKTVELLHEIRSTGRSPPRPVEKVLKEAYEEALYDLKFMGAPEFEINLLDKARSESIRQNTDFMDDLNFPEPSFVYDDGEDEPRKKPKPPVLKSRVVHNRRIAIYTSMALGVLGATGLFLSLLGWGIGRFLDTSRLSYLASDVASVSGFAFSLGASILLSLIPSPRWYRLLFGKADPLPQASQATEPL
jgi:hypothetical protein